MTFGLLRGGHENLINLQVFMGIFHDFFSFFFGQFKFLRLTRTRSVWPQALTTRPTHAH